MTQRTFLTLRTDTLSSRMLLIAVCVAALVFAWFAARWQLGSMLAELTSVSDPNAAEIADLALSLSPADPQAWWFAASEQKLDFSQESIDSSVVLFESAVRRSPKDFRWWIELARAYEQAERFGEAEAAFRRAVELAPSYTFPRWQIGNFLLRQGRTDEAFAELRRTTEQSIAYREQVFSLAWDYFDRDPQRVIDIAADRPDVKATLASFFALRGRPEEALRVWNQLSNEQKAPHKAIARDIAQGLFDRRYYRQALEFARQTGIDSEAEPEVILNPGFERFIGQQEDTLFGWRIGRGDGRIEASPDQSIKTEGGRGLKVTFRNYLKPDLYNVRQTVAVEPGGRYRLSFMVRTENLKSGGPPLVRVTAGQENAVIGTSAPFPIGTHEWKQITFDLDVPENADGIEISTGRVFCGEGCPLTGTFWYDDFRLVRR